MGDSLVWAAIRELSNGQDSVNDGTTEALVSMRELFRELLDAYISLAERIDILEKNV